MEIRSMTHLERVYETTLEQCTCPQWIYRVSVGKTQKGLCKHQELLLKSQ